MKMGIYPLNGLLMPSLDRRRGKDVAFEYGDVFYLDSLGNLHCFCGSDKFLIIQKTEDYRTVAKCSECHKEHIIHDG